MTTPTTGYSFLQKIHLKVVLFFRKMSGWFIPRKKFKKCVGIAYSLSHKKSEKMFWIVTWPTLQSHRLRDKRRFPSKIANFSHHRVLYNSPRWNWVSAYRAPQSFNPALAAASPPQRWQHFLVGERGRLVKIELCRCRTRHASCQGGGEGGKAVCSIVHVFVALWSVTKSTSPDHCRTCVFLAARLQQTAM